MTNWPADPEAATIMPANAAASVNEAGRHAARNDLRSAMDSLYVAFCQMITTYEMAKGKEWVDAPELLRTSAYARERRLDHTGFALLQRYAPRIIRAVPYGDRYIIQRVGPEPRPTQEEYARCYAFVLDSTIGLLSKPQVTAGVPLTSGHGKIEHDVRVEDEVSFHGMIVGNVVVVRGGVFSLHGTVTGNVTIEPGGEGLIYGTIHGAIVNRGRQLRIHGVVQGMVHDEAGTALIAPDAVVTSQIR